ncbi:hypothetical protein [Puia dinghuensis]|uniref:DUF4402 domain-containing protein n=1 Tax=Puia dinghuensis TaxID=1792502 RepID=A0A8J2U697_9BACT|nr:hypothetical protein [Puia dinghuensis]GGA81535.1 hypothetical protein GCM10011511_00590 [Puia dinghuensis]
MKPFLLLTLLVSALPAITKAQTPTTAKGPDPEFINIIYFWPGDTLRLLEKTTGEMKTKGMGFIGARGGGGSASLVINGPHSPARLKAGGDIRFAIKLSSMTDPSSIIKLYRFDAEKRSRETPMGGDSKHTIDFNIQKSGDDVYILIPATRLAPGEYAFQDMMMVNTFGMGKMSYTFFAFGVDQ